MPPSHAPKGGPHPRTAAARHATQAAKNAMQTVQTKKTMEWCNIFQRKNTQLSILITNFAQLIINNNFTISLSRELAILPITIITTEITEYHY